LKLLNVLLEKYREEHLDASYDKWSTAKSKGGKGHPIGIERKKANWIGHVCRRNCFPKHVTERK
jgi:hypothetical protein